MILILLDTLLLGTAQIVFLRNSFRQTVHAIYVPVFIYVCVMWINLAMLRALEEELQRLTEDRARLRNQTDKDRERELRIRRELEKFAALRDPMKR